MNDVNELNTDQLIQQAAAGDQEASDRLLEVHRQRLRGMVAVRMDTRMRRRVDPSDVVQETLVIAHTRLPDYLTKQPIPFYPWLRSLAWNHLTDLQRRHIGSQKRSIDREVQLAVNDESALLLADQLNAASSSPSQKLMREELKQRVMAALENMPEDQREILVMRHLEGMSVDEIAATLEMPAGTVMSRHFRSLQAMRKILDD